MSIMAMQTSPLNGPEREVVRTVLSHVLQYSRKAKDDTFDFNPAIRLVISGKEYRSLQRAMKKI